MEKVHEEQLHYASTSIKFAAKVCIYEFWLHLFLFALVFIKYKVMNVLLGVVKIKQLGEFIC